MPGFYNDCTLEKIACINRAGIRSVVMTTVSGTNIDEVPGIIDAVVAAGANAIHTFAGVQLRAACAELMAARGAEEPTGRAKITPAFNLPCRYVLHTVGPIVRGPVSRLYAPA